MDKTYLSDLYFKWMCSIAFPDEQLRSHYYNALNLLNSIEFTYSISLDENRLVDGLDLRYHFSYASKIPYQDVVDGLYYQPCSVLEMMIALARRCEDSIMSNDEYGDRTSQWFWKMFVNLGLDKYPDSIWNESVQYAAIQIVSRFLSRDYDPDGNGSLFKFNNPNLDIRNLEIWDQMCLYMSEIVNNDLRI